MSDSPASILYNASGTPVATATTTPGANDNALVVRTVETNAVATGTLSALNAAVTLAVDPQHNGASVQWINTSLVATVIFETSIDSGTTWNTLYANTLNSTSGAVSFAYTTADSTGRLYELALPPGATHVRARLSAYTSGSTAVTIVSAKDANTIRTNVVSMPSISAYLYDDASSATTLGSLGATVVRSLNGRNAAMLTASSGTLVGTLVPEWSADGGTNYIAAGAQFYDPATNAHTTSKDLTNPNGVIQLGIIFPPGANAVRVRVLNYTSGSVSATLRTAYSVGTPASTTTNPTPGQRGLVTRPILASEGSPNVNPGPSQAVAIGSTSADGYFRAVKVSDQGEVYVQGAVTATGPLTNTELRASPVPVSGTVTANVGTTGGIALDATLTGGSQKAINRGGAKGATSAMDITGTVVDADHNALDVAVKSLPASATEGVPGVNPGPAKAVAVGSTSADGYFRALKVNSEGELTVNVDSVTVPVPVTDNGGSLTVDGTVTANQGGTWSVNSTQQGTWTVQPGNVANTTPWLVDINDTVTVAGTVTSNIGTTGGLALDSTLTGGNQKSIVRSATKGATPAGDVTSTAVDANTQALDVAVKNTLAITGTVTANQGGAWNVSATQQGTWTVQPGNVANTTPWLVDINDTVTVAGTVTANIGTTNGLALDATLTGGNQKSIVRSATKGSTVAGDVTSTNVDANRQALDVFIRGSDQASTVTAYQGGAWNVSATQQGTWTVQPGNVANTTPWLTSISGTATVAGTVTANIGTTNGLALDSTLTSGNQKSILRSATKGATPAGDVTSTNVDSNTQALDVYIKGSATSSTVTANQGGSWTVNSTQQGVWTVQPGNVANTTPWLVSVSGTPTVSGTVTANIGTTNGLALDATLTGGLQKSIVRSATKGSTTAGDVTSTNVDANRQALDVYIRGSDATSGSTVTANQGGYWAVDASQQGAWTVQPGNVANTTPWLVDISNTPSVTGTVTANIGSTNGLALDATLTGGNQKSIVRSATKGATPAGDVTSTNVDANTQALDVAIKNTVGVSGTITANQGGTWAVNANQNGTWTVQPGNTANTTPWLVNSRLYDSAGNAFASATAAPAGTERALLVRNIPSGTQTISGTVTANLGTIAGVATETTAAAINTKLGGTIAVSGPLTNAELRATPVPVSGTVAVTGTFWQATQPISVASLPLPTGAALDATLTNGTQKAVLRTATKGSTPAGDATSTNVDANRQALDVYIRGSDATSGSTVTANQGGSWSVDATQTGTWTVQPGNTANTTPWLVNSRLYNSAGTAIATATTTPGASDVGIVVRNIPSGTQAVSGTVTANIGTTNGLALDATLTGGSQKAINRGGAKGATAAMDITGTSIDADHNALDVSVKGTATVAGTVTANLGTIAGVATETTLSGINGKLPTLGQKTKAGSVGVTLASDQGALSVSPGGQFNVGLQDTAGNALTAMTTAPAGGERGLVVRNIPSGVQEVSGEMTATVTGNVDIDQIVNIVPTGIAGNLITAPRDFTDPAWVKTNLTVVGDTLGDPENELIFPEALGGLSGALPDEIWDTVDGSPVPHTLSQHINTGDAPGGPATFSFIARSQTTKFVFVSIGSNYTYGYNEAAGETTYGVVFSLPPSGGCTVQSNPNALGTSIEHVGEGFYRICVTVPYTYAGGFWVNINLDSGLSGSPEFKYQGTVARPLAYLSHAQLEPRECAMPYTEKPVVNLPEPVRGVYNNALSKPIKVDQQGRIAVALETATSVAVTGSGTNAALPVEDIKTSSTCAYTNVASSASTVTLLAAGYASARFGVSIFNDSTATLYVRLGAGATTSAFTTKVPPDSLYEVPERYIGQITGIWSAANGYARVTVIGS